jgi:hypothetical protein
MLVKIGALQLLQLKSVRRPAQETDISKLSAASVMKLFKLRPYKEAVVCALQPRDRCEGKESLQNESAHHRRVVGKHVEIKFWNFSGRTSLGECQPILMVERVFACTGTSFSAPLNVRKLIFCSYGAILDTYWKNLVALGGESFSFCREPASNRCTV